MHRLLLKVDIQTEASCPLCREPITNDTWYTVGGYAICFWCGGDLIGDEVTVIRESARHQYTAGCWSNYRGIIFFTPAGKVRPDASANAICGITRQRKPLHVGATLKTTTQYVRMESDARRDGWQES